jgi:hypothetical protein
LREATELSVALALETDMKTKTLVIGAIAATAVVAGGWALAQTPRHFAPPFMRGDDTEMHGPGMMRRMNMGPGMMHQKGPGMGTMHQRGPAMGPGMTHRQGPGLTLADPTQIDGLKDELGITGAQEPAWNKYVKAIQDSAAAMTTAREGVDPNTVAKMTPQDRYAFVTKMREQAQKRFDAVQAATDELFATLDETQKAKATDVLPNIASFGPGPTRGADIRGPMHSHQGR